MDKPSLSMQRQSMEHLLNHLEAQANATGDDRWQQMIERARWGCVTLLFFERREKLVRAVHALDASEPLLAEFVKAFPDATVREIVECQ